MNLFRWALLCVLQQTLVVGKVDATTEDSSPPQHQQRRGMNEEALEVIGSTVFSVVIEDGLMANITWDDFKSELVWAVDVLALETISLMDNTWGRSLANTDNNKEDPSSNHRQRQLNVRVDVPTSLGLSPSGRRTPCPVEVGDAKMDRCEKVYAAIRLVLDDDQDDPIQTEQAFEAIFNAAVGYGRLQTILEESFPESVVRVYSDIDGSVSEADGNRGQLPSPKPNDTFTGNYFPEDDDSIQANDSSTTMNTESDDEGLSLVGLLGILAGVFLLFAGAGIYAFVLGHRRISTLFSVGSRNNDMKKESIPEIEQQETDLIENFSVAGLEWGSPEVTEDEKPERIVRPAEKDGKKKAHVENSPDAGVALYRMPSSLKVPQQLTPMSDMTGPSNASSNGSVETPEYMTGLVAQSGTSQSSSEEDSSCPPPGLAVNLDGLEAAIVEGDWNTLAAAANAISSDQNSQTDLTSVSIEWSNRDKSWQDALDATRAAELDHLIEEGDWTGIIEAAARYGSQKADEA